MKSRIAIAAAALMVGAASPALAQSVKAGIDAWQAADYSRAVAIWRPLAEKGDADAQFNLGQAYRLGRGVPINLATAKRWFERAAAQGHVDGETTLGLLLFQNGDQAEGLKWLRKAADQGEPRALLVFGTALVNGDGVGQDPVLGYAYVSRAAAQGLQPAKETLKQLDQLLPLADRQKGVKLAQAKAKAAPPPSSEPREPAETKIPSKAAPGRSVKTAPAVPEAPQAAAAKTAALGGWRIQLGAFSQKSSAEALFGRLSAKAPLAGRQAYYVAAGSVTRLQVGPFESKSAAAAACHALGVPCFPAPAR